MSDVPAISMIDVEATGRTLTIKIEIPCDDFFHATEVGQLIKMAVLDGSQIVLCGRGFLMPKSNVAPR